MIIAIGILIAVAFAVGMDMPYQTIKAIDERIQDYACRHGLCKHVHYDGPERRGKQ